MRAQVARSQLSFEGTEAGCSAVYRFDPSLSIFDGHFPGAPLVPGVYLIEGVRHCAAQRVGQSLVLVEMMDVRFTAPALPGQEIVFEVALEGESGARDGAKEWIARASAQCEGQRAAKLRLRLREASS